MRVLRDCIGFAVAAGLAMVAAGCTEHDAATDEPKPPEVTVSTPLSKPVTEYATFTGHVAATDLVKVSSRVTGYLEKAFFKEGDEVKKGDKLIEIDRRPYQAEVERLAAQLQ